MLNSQPRRLALAIIFVINLISSVTVHGQRVPDVGWKCVENCSPPPAPGGGPSEPTKPSPDELRQQEEQAMHDANDRGLEYAKRGDFKGAIKAFEEALQHSPDDSIILTNIKRAKERLAKRDARSQIEAKVEKLRTAFASDQDAIRRLGFERRAEEFEEWDRLSEAAKDEFKAKSLDALLSVTLTGIETGTRQLAGLNPPTANRIITQLQSLGVGDPYLFDAIRRVGGTQGKPQMAEAVEEFVKRFSRAKDVMVTAKALDGRPRRDIAPILEGVAAALSWGLKDPRLEIAAASAQVIAYSWLSATASGVSVYQVNRLTELTTSELQDLKVLSVRLHDHTRELRRAKAELVTLKE